MIQQKLIGSITFILGLLVLGIYSTVYMFLNPAEVFSTEPIDQLIMVYSVLMDGILGLVAGVLLFKGIKAGYILGMIVWGGSMLFHLYEVIIVSSQESFNPSVNIEQYVIIADAAGFVAGIFVLKWLCEDFKKEPFIALS